MCVDYRRLNTQTVKDNYNLPRIDEIFVALHDKKHFVSMDLLMGYHQVRVNVADRAKTAFSTHMGLFQFNVMPFGLCNAPGTFQRMMDGILRGDLKKDAAVYLDDVLTLGNTIDQTLSHPGKNIFGRFRQQG